MQLGEGAEPELRKNHLTLEVNLVKGLLSLFKHREIIYSGCSSAIQPIICLLC